MACLWKAGYAVSDPGFSFYHPELRMFDPVSQEGRQLLYAFTEGLSGGCDASCQVCCCFPHPSHDLLLSPLLLPHLFLLATGLLLPVKLSCPFSLCVFGFILFGFALSP